MTKKKDIIEKHEPICSIIGRALCCKEFSPPICYESLKEDYDTYITTGSSRWQQIEIIFPMLIPLDRKPSIGKNDNSITYYYYKCKNLKRNRCTIHNSKPDMCKSFGITPCKYNYPNCKSNCFKNDILKEKEKI